MLALKQHYTVYLGAGIIRLGKAQLLAGAQHAQAFYAAHICGVYHYIARKVRAVQRHRHQRPLIYVSRAGNYAYVFFPAHVYGADLELICVGVLGQRLYPAYYDIGDAGHLVFYIGHFKAAPHHQLHEFLGSNVKIHIFL